MLRTLRRLACALPLALAAACGSDDGPTVAELPANTTFDAALNVDLAQFTRTSSGLYFQDLAPGTGEPIARGQLVAVHYTGWVANSATPFESSVSREPIVFTLGVGQVIRGWDEGIAGLRVGGRRRLVIPPELGYGARPNGPIPANSVLVFEVERVPRT